MNCLIYIFRFKSTSLRPKFKWNREIPKIVRHFVDKLYTHFKNAYFAKRTQIKMEL